MLADDIPVHRAGGNGKQLVFNTGTRNKDFTWIRSHVGAWPGVEISDDLRCYSLLVLQGRVPHERCGQLLAPFSYATRIVIPPSMIKFSPVMKSFSTSSTIARATSSGLPSRWSGIRFLILFSTCSGVRKF